MTDIQTNITERQNDRHTEEYYRKTKWQTYRRILQKDKMTDRQNYTLTKLTDIQIRITDRQNVLESRDNRYYRTDLYWSIIPGSIL